VHKQLTLGDMLVFRCAYENEATRTNEASLGFNALPTEYSKIQKNKAILFKNQAIYIPLILKWKSKHAKVVGVAIISKFGFFQSKNQKKLRNSSIIQKSTFDGTSSAGNTIVKSNLLKEFKGHLCSNSVSQPFFFG
jgi:hypothetical protein